MTDRRLSLAAWSQEISLLPGVRHDQLVAIRRRALKQFRELPPADKNNPASLLQSPGSLAAVMYAVIKAGMTVDEMLRLDAEVLVQKATEYEEFVNGESAGDDPDATGSG